MDFDSPFEKAVYDALVARGHQVDIQVGCSGYRIDLAVRHPDEPGRYVLGIECDGAAYHSAASARDRDRLRQQVLERLGWSLHRIWSTDYWANASHEIDRAEEAIRMAISCRHPTMAVGEAVQGVDGDVGTDDGSDVREENDGARFEGSRRSSPLIADPVGAAEVSEAKIAGHYPSPDRIPQPGPGSETVSEEDAFEKYTTSSVTGPRSKFENGDTAAIVKVMAAIVEAEGPVEADYLDQRTMWAFDIARMGSRVKTALERAHAPLSRQGYHLKGGAFWRRDQDPETWRGIRISDGGETFRKPDQIPLAELANALDHHLQQFFGASADELMRYAAKTFGTSSLGKKVRKRMQAALDHLVAAGRAVKDDDQVRLPS